MKGFLLVIGVLIAVKINNLNNDYQMSQKILASFKHVENELVGSIIDAAELLEYYEIERDVTADFMLEKFIVADYSKPGNRILQSLGLNFKKLIIVTN